MKLKNSNTLSNSVSNKTTNTKDISEDLKSFRLYSIIQNGREVEMVTHRRVARPNSQDSRHGNCKSEGVVCKTTEMSEQGTLVGSNPTSPTSYNKDYSSVR